MKKVHHEEPVQESGEFEETETGSKSNPAKDQVQGKRVRFEKLPEFQEEPVKQEHTNDAEEEDRSKSDLDEAREPVAANQKRIDRRILEKKKEICDSCAIRDESILLPCQKCRYLFHPQCCPEQETSSTDAPSLLCANCHPQTEPFCFLCSRAGDAKKESSHHDEELKMCTIKTCAKNYHSSCLRNFLTRNEAASSPFICPAHYCHTCAAQMISLHQPHKKIVRCIKCPTSYHSSELSAFISFTRKLSSLTHPHSFFTKVIFVWLPVVSACRRLRLFVRSTSRSRRRRRRIIRRMSMQSGVSDVRKVLIYKWS